MFSFRGRIGRWDFFKGCMALLAACIVPALLVFPLIGPIRAGSGVALVTMIVLLVAAAATIFWIGLALQAKRLRDIGWNPVYVLPAWFAVQILDSLVAFALPRFAVGHGQHQTALGGLVNLGMLLAMTFWPGGEADGTPPLARTAEFQPVEAPAAAPAPPPRPNAGRATPSFGRRGLTT